jgi:hypothetical protein
VYALHSSMVPLDFSTDPSFECTDNDSGDLAFIRATSLNGGRDAVQEYLACGMFPLSANFSFAEIVDGVTLPLPEVLLIKLQGESEGGARCGKCSG